ncbi:MAG: glycoside hydrolase family 15 protein [Acetobacteraceae bacterium]
MGNCTLASLIKPEGRHVWFCFPCLDGDPVFHALLGGTNPARGFLEPTLRDQRAQRQYYLENIAIIATELEDSNGGKVRIIDFCPRFRQYGRIFRPPMIVRRIEPARGRPRVTVRLRPGFDYGAATPQVGFGSNHLRFIGPHTVLRLTTDMPLSHIVYEAEMVLDRPMSLFLGTDEPVPENPDALARKFLDETQQYWLDWVRDLNVPFDWQEAVVRAAITLKLCSYDDTGGILAALTTSIPEAPGSRRNWDYRFCWPRDSWFTVTALNRLSATRTMEGFLRYLANTVLKEGGSELAPLYPAAPGVGLGERIAESLEGFGAERPVRIGNAAATQHQNDVYGAIILTAAEMLWDRLHRLGGIAGLLGLEASSIHWFERAEAVRRAVLTRAADHGWISGVLDAEALDASTLLLPELGLIGVDDPRFLATLAEVDRRLIRNGFVMRYDEADDFGHPETAFLVCTFWYIDALAAGRKVEAKALFANLLAHRNHVGLLSENIDPKTGVLWGNFPQSYSRVGLILSAMRLSRSWEQGLRGATPL